SCMDWLNVDDVQLSTNAPDSMAPFIKGEWMFGDDSDRALRLLDQVAILRSTRWAA
ncbi:MAG: chemotaxis protein CheW, partial [Symploca sp. SIO2B6]|nr:chemotaxis protein CheW [Symploca sp. SIO2B6]